MMGPNGLQGCVARCSPAVSLALLSQLLVGIAAAKPPSPNPAGGSGDELPRTTIDAGGSSLPAEELRLDTGVFRAGLQKRGLSEVLELHLRDFPPSSAVARLLMTRDVRLAEFADVDRPIGERRAAIVEANRLLEQLITEAPDDPRRFAWRFALAYSLLYDEAEPLLAPVLYHEKPLRDAGESDRLGAMTARALAVVSQLDTDLKAELAGIDRLAVEEFEKLNASGRVRELEQLSAQLDYLQLWVLLYHAVSRSGEDPARIQSLNELLQFCKANPQYLETPHDRSRVQVQVLLLAGMAKRRSEDLPGARGLLDRAVAAASQIDDVVERERIRWAMTLASLERVRCARDERRFTDAHAAIAQLRGQIPAGDEGFPFRFLAAITERLVTRAAAEAAAQSNRTEEAKRLTGESWRTMVGWLESEPTRREDFLLAAFELVRDVPDSNTLDPFDQCATVIGLLSTLDSGSRADPPPALEAVRIAESFLSAHRADGGILVPEMQYALATARYRSGDVTGAAKAFLDFAMEFPTSDRAEAALSYAVQLSAQLDAAATGAGSLSGDGSPPSDSKPTSTGDGDAERRDSAVGARTLRFKALVRLYERHPESATGKAWRFQFATMLEEQGDYDRAAEHFARIERGEDEYVDACFARLRATSRGIRRDAGNATVTRTELNRRVDQLRRLLEPLATIAADANAAPERAQTARLLLTRGKVILAEIDTLPGIEQFARALQTLETFESTGGDVRPLAGRVWRVRLLAYERLDRLESAREAIPAYLASDPTEAATTLQGLYDTLVAEVDAGVAPGEPDRARAKAQTALVIAQQLHEHAPSSPTGTNERDRRLLTLQLAEAHLRADLPEQARELFAGLVPRTDDLDETRPAESVGGTAPAARPSGETVPPDRSTLSAPEHSALATGLASDPFRRRAYAGLAEAHFRLNAFDDALPLFNALVLNLPRKDAGRWKYLLRDLQCRTARGEPAADIIKVIQQQRILQPDLGGPALAAEFEKLLRENERRAEEKP